MNHDSVEHIEVRLRLRSSEEGGRASPITSGYRGGLLVFPAWYASWDEGGQRRCLGAVAEICSGDELSPGDEAIVRFEPWADHDAWSDVVRSGVEIRLYEGARLIGHGRVLRVLADAPK